RRAACDSGRTRLRAPGRCCAACACAEPVARRSARRHHLLPPLSQRALRARHRATVPRGVVPQHGHRSARAAHRGTHRLSLRRRAPERRDGGAGIGVLPRPMRAVPGHDGQRHAARQGHAAEVRRAFRRREQMCGGDGMTRIYVPRDSSALALGADDVAQAIQTEAARRGIEIELVRNGTRGLLWLEPLVEVATAEGRVGYANVEANDVAGLFDAGLVDGGEHARRVGVVDEIPYLKKQQRLTFARIGITDPLSIDDYVAHGGLEGLRNALQTDGDAACEALIESGLRGRGGAAFPAGIKWRTVRGTQAAQKYIVCNADEGDSGTFSDRLVMESDPYLLIEGMLIAGVVTGATVGYIYVRSEYPHSIATLEAAIARARAAGWLGDSVL